jgi:predicted regulator of Ras-like GTPase activity (Roadblock/LC7/MglB family)
VLASLVADEIDVDLVAAAARDIFGCTMLAIKESNHQSQLHQMVCLTCQGYVVIANFGGGLLVTLTDTNDVGAVVSPAPFG